MDREERLSRLTRNTEEIVTVEELSALIASETSPKGYVGFEPSGLVHLGWMILAAKIEDFVNAGFNFTVFFADWHAYINDKLAGNIDSIRTCANYMEDCFQALGVPSDKVAYKFASEIMDDISYWEKVIKIGKSTTLTRVKRALTIMGRQEDEAEMDASKTLYPLMQAADIFELDVDVAYAGLDQRRAHMLAREAAEKLGWKKPVALHTPLLPGLKGTDRMDPVSTKMSKSDPDSAILIHDSPDEIKRKIGKAFCPPTVDGNPVLALYRLIIFDKMKSVAINRPEKFGGPLEFRSYVDIESTYAAGNLHPMDLKNGASEALVQILQPVREYFERKPQRLKEIREITT
ncbi:MAG: tyrosine--tRNA ligase [Methanomassiliicoccales archaeon]|jgi:tyrosyl-tRNA synthetase